MACPPAYMPKGHGLELYAKAKEAVKIPILAGSRMGDPWICAKALRDGQADAFVLSRPSLADPEFPKKTELGMPEKIRPCIGCNFGCIGRVEDQGLPPACAVNPRAERIVLSAPEGNDSQEHYGCRRRRGRYGSDSCGDSSGTYSHTV